MMKLLLLLSLFFLTCGNPGQQAGNSFLIGDTTEIPAEFLNQICGGSNSYEYKLRINSSAGGGRLSGELEEGQYPGKALRKFIGQKGRDGILYIEEKGEEQFNVVIRVCREIRGPSDFRIDAVGLSTKTTRCPPYEDINYATVSFNREGSDYQGYVRTVRDEFYFSAFQCY